jgi:hypothetical protein
LADQGLTNYIFAKNGRAQNIPRITKQACIQFLISCTLFLFNHFVGTHIRNNQANFPLAPTKLETTWLTQAQLCPTININLYHHFLNKLLLYHITSNSQIALPNGTHLMTYNDFQIYPTSLQKLFAVH